MTEETADPRLAHTGREVLGREIIDNQVLLADFERFLEIGEQWERDEEADKETGTGICETWELLGFIDRHGRQLLELARQGAAAEEERGS